MNVPPAVRAAAGAVCIVCTKCWESSGDVIEVRVGDHGLELHHRDANCRCVTRADGPEACDLAEYVLSELAQLVFVADYGEPLPRQRWAVA